jgi:hypothetical protein
MLKTHMPMLTNQSGRQHDRWLKYLYPFPMSTPRYLLALLCVLPACLPMSSTSVKLEKLQKRLAMETGPCFGTCPVYTLTVYEKDLITYEGRRYTERTGLYSRFLTKSERQRLENAMSEVDLWTYQDVYRSQIPDMATVTLTQYEPDGRKKSVRGKDGRPEPIMQLEELLREIAEQGDWKKHKDQPEQPSLAADAVPNELIVQLKGRVDVQQWLAKYRDQNMQIRKKLSPDRAYFLVSFDANAISPQDMLERVRRDPDVSSAQFNKRLSPRE